MNKYISKIAFVALMALSFVACTSDDTFDSEQPTTYQDEKGKYVPITVQADYGMYSAGNSELGSRADNITGTGTYSDDILTEITSIWHRDSKLTVLFDGMESELTLVTGLRQSTGTFQGRLYYKSATIPTTTALHFYSKNEYVELNASSPTTYKMKDIATQTGEFDEAMRRTVWYGTVSKYALSGMTVTLKPQTAMLHFTLRGPLQASVITYNDAAIKIEGKGWGNNATDLIQFNSTIGNTAKQFYYCVNTKNTVTAEKVVVTCYNKIYERLIGQETKQIKLTAGAIYNKPHDSYKYDKMDDSPTLRVGDFLYSDGGWGDDPTPESGHKVIGIVISKKSNFNSLNGQESLHGTAMALTNAAYCGFCTTDNANVAKKHTTVAAAMASTGLTVTDELLSNSSTNWLAAKAARDYSAKVPVPNGCSEWYLPSAAEAIDMVNALGGGKGTYAYTPLSEENPLWWNTVWDDTNCMAEINKKLDRTNSSYRIPSSITKIGNSNMFWTTDRYNDTYFLGLCFSTDTNYSPIIRHYLSTKNEDVTLRKVRPFIQF